MKNNMGKKMQNGREQTISWTKEEMKKLIAMWETKTVLELCDELGRRREQILYMANQMRRAGLDLPRKSKRGLIRGLILEVKAELEAEGKSKRASSRF
jgi:hypothetical protein